MTIINMSAHNILATRVAKHFADLIEKNGLFNERCEIKPGLFSYRYYIPTHSGNGRIHILMEGHIDTDLSHYSQPKKESNMEEQVEMTIQIGVGSVKALHNFLDKNGGSYEGQAQTDEEPVPEGQNEGGPEGAGSSDVTEGVGSSDPVPREASSQQQSNGPGPA